MKLDELNHLAAKSEPIPDGLTLPEQWLYLSLRILYREYQSGVLTKEQAALEKRRLIEQYELMQLHHSAYQQATERSKQYSLLLVEAEKTGCDVCKKIVRIFDGRN